MLTIYTAWVAVGFYLSQTCKYHHWCDMDHSGIPPSSRWCTVPQQVSFQMVCGQLPSAQWEGCTSPLWEAATWHQEIIFIFIILETWTWNTWCCLANGDKFGISTTLRSKRDPGKLGLFLKFLMTAVWTISPPHSTIKLGEETVANW